MPPMSLFIFSLDFIFFNRRMVQKQNLKTPAITFISVNRESGRDN